MATIAKETQNNDLQNGGQALTEQQQHNPRNADILLTVPVDLEGKVVNMSMQEYLYGVLSAEMPASYPLEALKAQAVAARTYTISRLESAKKDTSSGAQVAISTDPRHGEAYLSLDQAKEKWGQQWVDKYYSKIKSAVDSTNGEILHYQNEPIVAAFHAMSGGHTENAVDVWGGNYPYLVGVESPGDMFESDYETKVDIAQKDFEEKILAAYPEAKLSGDPASWVTEIVRTKAGGVRSVIIGGVNIKGTQIRELFGLRSANFAISYSGDSFHFIVRGYGHGVGMSQAGAAYMAKQGKNYKEILSWYYSGTQIVRYQG